MYDAYICRSYLPSTAFAALQPPCIHTCTAPTTLTCYCQVVDIKFWPTAGAGSWPGGSAILRAQLWMDRTADAAWLNMPWWMDTTTLPGWTAPGTGSAGFTG